jgi:hypothetical protein
VRKGRKKRKKGKKGKLTFSWIVISPRRSFWNAARTCEREGGKERIREV